MPPKRPRLGQHFLRDERYAERAVEAAGLTPDDVVLEVGPGHGVLTRRLAERAREVHALELDRNLAAMAREWAPPNVHVIEGDAVQVEWPSFTACVSNLPYQISGPFLFRLLDTAGWRVSVLMVQKEFADRLVAEPGTKNYGRLTVNAHYRARAERVTRVPPGAFQPPPRVQSALVRLTPRPPPFEVQDPDLLFRVVDAAFSQRRKTLLNGLRRAAGRFGLPPIPQDLPHASQRPEVLAPAEFGEVADALSAASGPEKARAPKD